LEAFEEKIGLRRRDPSTNYVERGGDRRLVIEAKRTSLKQGKPLRAGVAEKMRGEKVKLY